MKSFYEIIESICEELHIKYTYLSNKWVMKLGKDNITKYISGYKFDLNSHGLGVLLDDKFATYDLLSNNNIDSVRHHIIYSENNMNDYAIGLNTINYVEELFNKYNNDVVLKMNTGSCGLNVYHATNKDELISIYHKLSKKYSAFSLSPYINATCEYRVIILDGVIKLIYGKVKPIVIGNGKSTIKELLIDFNSNYFNSYDKDNKDEVLPINKIYMYDWKFNLSRGAKITEDIDKKTIKKLSKIAIDTANSIGLRFGSIDILKSNDNDYKVLEINSGVMMSNFINQKENGFNIAKDIYKEAIEKMFK